MAAMKSILSSTLGLGVILFSYSIFGAIIFLYLESWNTLLLETKSQDDDMTTSSIESSTSSAHNNKLHNEIKSALISIKENSDDGKLNTLFVVKLLQHLEMNLRQDEEPPHKLDFWKALYYCYTIYTSIGFGNVFPTNGYSRIFTCIYALFGIPLCLITLDRYGKIHSKLLNFIYRAICKLLKQQVEECSISFMLGVIVMYLLAGVYLYSTNEKWSLDESLYFLLVTFTTVGFGDVCPDDSRYFCLTIVYQFFGLSLVACFINMLVAQFEYNLSQLDYNQQVLQKKAD